MMSGELTRIENTLRRAYADALEAVRRDDTSPGVPPGVQPGRPPRGAGRVGGRRRWMVPAAAGAAVAVIALVAGLIVPNALHQRAPHRRPALAAPPLDMAYVVSSFPDEVTPVNLATGVALQPIDTGIAGGVSTDAITPDGRKVYFVTNQGWAASVDTVARTFQKIWIGGTGGDMLISSDGSMGYVLQPPYGVAVVDFALNKFVGFKKIHGATQFALTPDGKSVYVLAGAYTSSNEASFSVTRIDTATLTLRRPILAPENVTFGRSFGLTPDGKTLYVLGNFASGAKSAVLTPINTATNTTLAPIPLGATGHYDAPFSFSPDSRTAYFGSSPATSGSCTGAICRLTAIDLSTGAVTWTASVPDTGIYPAATTVAPDGQTMYALTPDVTPHTNFGAPALYRIPVATGIPQQIPAQLVPTDQWFAGSVNVSPDSRTIYVRIGIQTNNPDGTLGPAYASLVPIDAATGKAGPSIKLPAAGDLLFGPS